MAFLLEPEYVISEILPSIRAGVNKELVPRATVFINQPPPPALSHFNDGQHVASTYYLKSAHDQSSSFFGLHRHASSDKGASTTTICHVHFFNRGQER